MKQAPMLDVEPIFVIPTNRLRDVGETVRGEQPTGRRDKRLARACGPLSLGTAGSFHQPLPFIHTVCIFVHTVCR